MKSEKESETIENTEATKAHHIPTNLIIDIGEIFERLIKGEIEYKDARIRVLSANTIFAGHRINQAYFKLGLISEEEAKKALK